MGNRFINKRRTREVFLDDPNVSMWGFTKEDVEKLGWVDSDLPLLLSNEDCPICEGGGAHRTLNEESTPTLHSKCKACDGTGKKIIGG